MSSVFSLLGGIALFCTNILLLVRIIIIDYHVYLKILKMNVIPLVNEHYENGVPLRESKKYFLKMSRYYDFRKVRTFLER